MPPPREIIADGMRYVLVSDAIPVIADITAALVEQWWGESGTPPDYFRDELRVVVTDTAEDGEGDTLEDFAVRIMAAAARRTEARHVDPETADHAADKRP